MLLCMDDNDLSEFIEWARENSSRAPNPEHVTVSCERLVVVQLQRCAEFISAADENGYWLLDAARALHLAMVAAMTAALSGSAGIGASPPKQRIKAIAAMNAGAWGDVPERVMSYAELVEAIQTEGAMEWASALRLMQEEQEACAALNSLRERIDHPKTSTFSESRAEIRRVCALVAALVPRIMECVRHHFEEDDFNEVRIAAGIIAKLR